MKPSRTLPAVAIAALGLLAAGNTAAHDTWFATLAAEPVHPGSPRLALGTGNRFPRQESAIDPRFLAHSGCRTADGLPLPLQPLAPVRPVDTALRLAPGPGATACWAQLQAFDIEIAHAGVAVYLDEVRAPAAVRSRWAALREAGRPWQERYTKHARIELSGTPGSAPAMGLDLLREAEDTAPPRVGQPLVFRLLDQGRPLAGQALELRTELSPFGQWAQTDAEGRVRFTAALPGRWLLRGTEIRPATDRPDAWDSRFVTLAFDVQPRTPAP